MKERDLIGWLAGENIGPSVRLPDYRLFLPDTQRASPHDTRAITYWKKERGESGTFFLAWL